MYAVQCPQVPIIRRGFTAAVCATIRLRLPARSRPRSRSGSSLEPRAPSAEPRAPSPKPQVSSLEPQADARTEGNFQCPQCGCTNIRHKANFGHTERLCWWPLVSLNQSCEPSLVAADKKATDCLIDLVRMCVSPRRAIDRWRRQYPAIHCLPGSHKQAPHWTRSLASASSLQSVACSLSLRHWPLPLHRHLHWTRQRQWGSYVKGGKMNATDDSTTNLK